MLTISLTSDTKIYYNINRFITHCTINKLITKLFMNCTVSEISTVEDAARVLVNCSAKGFIVRSAVCFVREQAKKDLYTERAEILRNFKEKDSDTCDYTGRYWRHVLLSNQDLASTFFYDYDEEIINNFLVNVTAEITDNSRILFFHFTQESEGKGENISDASSIKPFFANGTISIKETVVGANEKEYAVSGVDWYPNMGPYSAEEMVMIEEEKRRVATVKKSKLKRGVKRGRHENENGDEANENEAVAVLIANPNRGPSFFEEFQDNDNDGGGSEDDEVEDDRLELLFTTLWDDCWAHPAFL